MHKEYNTYENETTLSKYLFALHVYGSVCRWVNACVCESVNEYVKNIYQVIVQ